MPRSKRNFLPNSYYHIYNRGNNKEQILKFKEDKQLFVNLLYKYCKPCKVRLICYCIMDNHFHLIVKSGEEPKNISKFMQKVTTSFAVQINRRRQRVGHVFQGRYNAKLLRYKKDLLRATKYIKQNPVRDGVAKKPSDYPWSKV
jgi:putative transposase